MNSSTSNVLYSSDGSEIHSTSPCAGSGRESDIPRRGSDLNEVTDLSSTFVCELCGKKCKNKQGYSLHTSRCEEQRSISLKCPHCDVTCSTIYKIRAHIESCKVYKKQQEEKQLNDRIQSYETQLALIQSQNEELLRSQDHISKQYEDLRQKEQHSIKRIRDLQCHNESMLKMVREEQDVLQKEKEQANHRLKEFEQVIKEQKEKIIRLEKKNDMLNSNMIEFAKKATEKITTIYNGNISHVQANTLQLQHFDASMFQDKIKPPFRMIYSIPQLVDHLHKFGFGNLYRSLDRSRNTVIWIDKDGAEVRDSNCSQLRERALGAMEGDLRRQLLYQKERESHLEKMEGTDHLDELENVRSNISFCHQLLNREAKMMKNLQKELSTRAKNKKDTTVDTPKLVGYTKFLAALEEVLFPNILEWILLPFDQLGKWLGNEMRHIIEVEGGSFHHDHPFILIKNDEGVNKITDPSEFHAFFQMTYYKIMTFVISSIVDHLLDYIPNVNLGQVDKFREWMDSPSKEESYLLLRSIVQTYR